MRTTLIVLFSILITTTVFAQTVSVDLNKIDPELAKQIIVEKSNTMPAPRKMLEWAQMGEGIAKALGAACKELSIEVNEFSKTPVGELTTFVIVWKMIGKDFINIFIGIGLLIVSLTFWWKSLYKVMLEQIQGKNGEFHPKFEFESSDARFFVGLFFTFAPIIIILIISCVFFA